jgi:hypothetical protein
LQLEAAVPALSEVRIRKPLLWYEAAVFVSLVAGFFSFPPEGGISSGAAYTVDTLGASVYFFVIQLMVVLPALTLMGCVRVLDWAAGQRHPLLRGAMAVALSPLPSVVWWSALRDRLRVFDLSDPGTAAFAFVAAATTIATAVILVLHRRRAEPRAGVAVDGSART